MLSQHTSGLFQLLVVLSIYITGIHTTRITPFVSPDVAFYPGVSVLGPNGVMYFAGKSPTSDSAIFMCSYDIKTNKTQLEYSGFADGKVEAVRLHYDIQKDVLIVVGEILYNGADDTDFYIQTWDPRSLFDQSMVSLGLVGLNDDVTASLLDQNGRLFVGYNPNSITESLSRLSTVYPSSQFNWHKDLAGWPSLTPPTALYHNFHNEVVYTAGIHNDTEGLYVSALFSKNGTNIWTGIYDDMVFISIAWLGVRDSNSDLIDIIGSTKENQAVLLSFNGLNSTKLQTKSVNILAEGVKSISIVSTYSNRSEYVVIASNSNENTNNFLHEVIDLRLGVSIISFISSALNPAGTQYIGFVEGDEFCGIGLVSQVQQRIAFSGSIFIAQKNYYVELTTAENCRRMGNDTTEIVTSSGIRITRTREKTTSTQRETSATAAASELTRSNSISSNRPRVTEPVIGRGISLDTLPGFVIPLVLILAAIIVIVIIAAIILRCQKKRDKKKDRKRKERESAKQMINRSSRNQLPPANSRNTLPRVAGSAYSLNKEMSNLSGNSRDLKDLGSKTSLASSTDNARKTDTMTKTQRENMHNHPQSASRELTSQNVSDRSLRENPKLVLHSQKITAQPVHISHSRNDSHQRDTPDVQATTLIPTANTITINSAVTSVLMGTPLTKTLTPTNAISPSSTQTDTSKTIKATVSNDQRELSLPGFLLMDPSADFELQQKLTESGMSHIYLANLKSSEFTARAGSSKAVVKVLKHVKEKEVLESFYNEVAIMWYFSENKNICELVGFASNPPMICVNYYERGSLSRYLRKEAGWSIHNVFSSCYDIANALSDLHDSGFVHGDVKTDNVLVDYDALSGQISCILTDFGLAKIVTSKVVVIAGLKKNNLVGASVAFAAPEVLTDFLSQQNATKKKSSVATSATNLSNTSEYQYIDPDIMKSSDVYSFAMIIWEMLNKETPWLGMELEEIYLKILLSERPELNVTAAEMINSNEVLGSLVKMIMERCWEQEPLSRWAMRKVLTTLHAIKRSEQI